MPGRELQRLRRAQGDAGAGTRRAPPARSRGRAKAASPRCGAEAVAGRAVGKGSASQPGRGHASSSQGLGCVPASDPMHGHPGAVPCRGKGAAGADEAAAVCPGKRAWQRPLPRREAPGVWVVWGVLARLFLCVVCEPGERGAGPCSCSPPARCQDLAGQQSRATGLRRG